ncbi:hypothetical protein QOZ80_6BG0492660 [Eleusine coracana subsp. coracana]|nr:hypothetical protein QOZ80_6BG0492660 [Eleusine coracana subsp. coracana]
MADHSVSLSKDESKIVAALEEALKSEKTNQLQSGTAINFYQFSYEASSIWHKGTIFPLTDSKSPFDKRRERRVSFCIYDAKEERRMRDLVIQLFPIEDNALLKPTFAAYNSMIEKTVLCCQPFSEYFSSWISRQERVPVDGYLRDQAKQLIRSLLVFDEVLQLHGYVCDGLDDPKNYVMMDFQIKVLPYTIRKKEARDSEMIHKFKIATLLENHLNTIWKDIDVEEFIECLRNRKFSLDMLLGHPIFLPPGHRMAVYMSLWKDTYTNRQKKLYGEITSYNNWVSRVPSNKTMWYILTYDPENKGNSRIMYGNTAKDAHKYARDTCSHYLKVWRQETKPHDREVASEEMVDKQLKVLLPGLLSKIYALSFDSAWKHI